MCRRAGYGRQRGKQGDAKHRQADQRGQLRALGHLALLAGFPKAPWARLFGLVLVVSHGQCPSMWGARLSASANKRPINAGASLSEAANSSRTATTLMG